MFTKTKRKYLDKILRAQIGCISLYIRKAYTTKHIGESPSLDKVLWEKAKGFILKEEEERDLSEEEKIIETEISGIIPIETIEKIVDNNKRYNDVAIESFKDDDNSEKVISIPLIELYRTYHKLKIQYNKQYDYFKILHMKTINIKYDNIVKVLTVSLPIFLFGSVLRIYIVCSSFSIRIEDAYDISDFISSSVSSLITAIWPIILSSIVYYIIDTEDSGLDPQSTSIENKKMINQTKYIVPFTVVIIGITVALSKQYYLLISSAALVFIVFILPRVSVRYFENAKIVFFASMFLINFTAAISSSTLQNIHKIKNDIKNTKYYVSFIYEMPYEKTMIYIEQTSRGVLFYEYLNKKVIIVKNEAIKSIEIRK